MNPIDKIIEGIPHEVLIGNVFKQGPVTQLFKVTFEGREAVLRIDLPMAKYLGLNRFFEAQLLTSIHQAEFGPKILFSNPSSGVLIWEFRPGETAEDQSAMNSELPKQLGQILKQIHQIKIDGSEPLFVDAIENYRKLLRDNNHPLIKKGFLLFDSLHVHQTPGVLSHNDINPGNILVNDDLLVLDWEYAGLNHPYFDLGNAIENFNFNHEQIQSLLGSYNQDIIEEGMDTLNQWRQFSLYLTFFWLMIIEKYATISKTDKAWMAKLERRLLQAQG